jgi:hypothetical protein
MLDRPAAEAAVTRHDRWPASRRPDEGDAVAVDIATAVAAIRRRKWWLLAPVLLCPLVTYIAFSQVTPSYTASGSLLYDLAQYKGRELQSILQADPITDAVMTSQAEVLAGFQSSSRSLIAYTLRKIQNSTWRCDPPQQPHGYYHKYHRCCLQTGRKGRRAYPALVWTQPAMRR